MSNVKTMFINIFVNFQHQAAVTGILIFSLKDLSTIFNQFLANYLITEVFMTSAGAQTCKITSKIVQGMV